MTAAQGDKILVDITELINFIKFAGLKGEIHTATFMNTMVVSGFQNAGDVFSIDFKPMPSSFHIVESLPLRIRNSAESLGHIEEAHEILFNSMIGVDEVDVRKLRRVSDLLLAAKLKLRQQQGRERGE